MPTEAEMYQWMLTLVADPHFHMLATVPGIQVLLTAPHIQVLLAFSCL